MLFPFFLEILLFSRLAIISPKVFSDQFILVDIVHFSLHCSVLDGSVLVYTCLAFDP